MDSTLKTLECQVTSGDFASATETLKQIKLARLTATGTVSNQQFTAALECGVFLAVKQKDIELFSRNMAQLQPLYAMGSPSVRKNHILGLNLMALLVTNCSSEFHSELELLPLTDQENDDFLKFPIAVERKLMVGIYDEILTMTLPDSSYQFFMDQLVSTVRDAIADCMEVSYEKLTMKQAAKQMNEPNVLDYIQTFREDWIVEGDTIHFAVAEESTSYTSADIPSKQWIEQCLTYATEIERIV